MGDGAQKKVDLIAGQSFCLAAYRCTCSIHRNLQLFHHLTDITTGKIFNRFILLIQLLSKCHSEREGRSSGTLEQFLLSAPKRRFLMAHVPRRSMGDSQRQLARRHWTNFLLAMLVCLWVLLFLLRKMERLISVARCCATMLQRDLCRDMPFMCSASTTLGEENYLDWGLKARTRAPSRSRVQTR